MTECFSLWHMMIMNQNLVMMNQFSHIFSHEKPILNGWTNRMSSSCFPWSNAILTHKQNSHICSDLPIDCFHNVLISQLNLPSSNSCKKRCEQMYKYSRLWYVTSCKNIKILKWKTTNVYTHKMHSWMHIWEKHRHRKSMCECMCACLHVCIENQHKSNFI